jgi:hypothetical protein
VDQSHFPGLGRYRWYQSNSRGFTGVCGSDVRASCALCVGSVWTRYGTCAGTERTDVAKRAGPGQLFCKGKLVVAHSTMVASVCGI